jgi:hypothetical protein
MNRLGKEARLNFSDGHFDILESGNYVICARTGGRIPLNQLKYWSVDNQEAYINCATGYLKPKKSP